MISRRSLGASDATRRQGHGTDGIRVLMSLSAPTAETRYSTQMSAGLPNDVEPLYFSYRTAFTSRYDLFHVHWPETLTRASTKTRAFVRTVLALLLLMRLRATRTPIVRTLHNETPHESGNGFEDRLLGLWDRQTDVFVILNRHSTTPPGKRRVLVPHGSYDDYGGGAGHVASESGRLLYFGLVRPYKRVSDLLAAFHEITDGNVQLAIVGQPNSDVLRNEIETAASADPRISADLRFASDDDLATAIRRCELVILPYAIHNSGALILALSLERPVLTLATPSVRDLEAEVGQGWLFYFEGSLTGDVLRSILDRVRATSALRNQPAFSGRDWTSVGLGYRRAYLTALGLPAIDPQEQP